MLEQEDGNQKSKTYETEIGRFRLPFLLAISATSSSLSLAASTSSPLFLWPPASSELLGPPSSCSLTLTVDVGEAGPCCSAPAGGSGEDIVAGAGDMGNQLRRWRGVC